MFHGPNPGRPSALSDAIRGPVYEGKYPYNTRSLPKWMPPLAHGRARGALLTDLNPHPRRGNLLAAKSSDRTMVTRGESDPNLANVAVDLWRLVCSSSRNSVLADGGNVRSGRGSTTRLRDVVVRALFLSFGPGAGQRLRNEAGGKVGAPRLLGRGYGSGIRGSYVHSARVVRANPVGSRRC